MSFFGRVFAQTLLAMFGTQGIRTFLRVCLAQVTVYAIGLRLTQRTEAPAKSRLALRAALRPQLIEPPIGIKSNAKA
jgi:hypothetical protein